MVKVLISLDKALVERLDREAQARRISRSALLADFAARGLGEARGPGARPEVQQAMRDLQALFAEAPHPGDITEIIRQDRDSHY